ncbi:Hypothetical predicted protein [Cloeon dipterum]|uniref:Uncharacterized protein n=1 Tax=Cloeon dipterum TaxID=197152 RepID=A0A8S1C3T2_9INSE|nr:Hypothetical predicted protein [Cloeon dipterum]
MAAGPLSGWVVGRRLRRDRGRGGRVPSAERVAGAGAEAAGRSAGSELKQLERGYVPSHQYPEYSTAVTGQYLVQPGVGPGGAAAAAASADTAFACAS